MFLESPLTTEEVRACCSDLRVLNKGDFKLLLKWRLQMLKEKKDLIQAMRRPSDSSLPLSAQAGNRKEGGGEERGERVAGGARARGGRNVEPW